MRQTRVSVPRSQYVRNVVNQHTISHEEIYTRLHLHMMHDELHGAITLFQGVLPST